MEQEILVDAVMDEKTHVGRVAFPTTVPQGLIELISFPDDVFKHARKMGLDDIAVKFLLAVLHGKWALTAVVDLQDVAISTGLKYPEMDAIVRKLLDYNYARLNHRLDLYRFWIVLLHLKGIEFTVD